MQQHHSEILIEPEIIPEKKSVFLRYVREVLETIILSVILFLVINLVSARIRVEGYSMVPTLETGEFVLVNKLVYMFNKPHFGDIVVFDFPKDPSQEYIKRVIGLPGDEVVIEDHQVFINNQIVSEPYIQASPRYNGSWVVPDQTVFVLGDNRNNSSDSHAWGTVPLENIRGKAIFVYWPPSKWGTLEEPTIAQASP